MSWDILPKNVLQYFLTKLKDKLDAISAAIPTKVSQLTNDSGYITSSGSCNYATSAGSATDSTKVAKAGDTMSGMLTMNTVDNVAIDFRNNSGYHTTASYQTAGNEALVLATKNAVTSFIFVNGEDSITNHANSRWQSLTPGLQIKKNSVAIGTLIANGSDPNWKLAVNGTGSFAGLRVKGRVYNAGDDEGIVIEVPDNSNHAGLVLGSHNGRRSVFYFNASKAFWRYNNGSTSYDINHPAKSGTIALTSDIPRKAYSKTCNCSYYNNSELHGSFTVDNANDVAVACPSGGGGLQVMSYFQCYKYSGTTWVIVCYGSFITASTKSIDFNVVVAPA